MGFDVIGYVGVGGGASLADGRVWRSEGQLRMRPEFFERRRCEAALRRRTDVAVEALGLEAAPGG